MQLESRVGNSATVSQINGCVNSFLKCCWTDEPHFGWNCEFYKKNVQEICQFSFEYFWKLFCIYFSLGRQPINKRSSWILTSDFVLTSFDKTATLWHRCSYLETILDQIGAVEFTRKQCHRENIFGDFIGNSIEVSFYWVNGHFWSFGGLEICFLIFQH